jgi:hypothetical protein
VVLSYVPFLTTEKNHDYKIHIDYSTNTYGKVHIGKHLSDAFRIQCVTKQGDALSSLLFNYFKNISLRRSKKITMDWN